MGLPDRLKQARIDKGLRLREVGDLAGVDRNTIWRYESGYRTPSTLALQGLAALYGKPVEWFFGEEPEVSLMQLEPENKVDSRQPEPNSTHEEDMAFIESQAELSYMRLQGELTPEEAREVRNFIEYTLGKREQGRLREDD